MGANTSRSAARAGNAKTRAHQPKAIDVPATSDRADVQRVLDGIRRIVQALRHSSREAERRAGISAAQLFVLSRLGAGGCSSLNELADRTFTHQSTVSTVVSKLVSARLVARTPAADDRRRLTLSLTARGRRVLAAAPDAAQERLITAITDLSATPRRLLGDTLTTLAHALATPGQRTRMFFDDGPGDGEKGARAPRGAEARRRARDAVRGGAAPSDQDTHDPDASHATRPRSHPVRRTERARP